MTIPQRKRILLITRNFPPLTGGMERLNYHIYLELAKEFDISIAGPQGCQNYLAAETAVTLFPYKPLGLFLVKSFIVTYRFAVQEKPDLIIAGSGVTAIAALIAGWRVGAKVMSFLHGLDILFPHPIYQLLFLPAIRACDGIWVNSRHTAFLAKQKKIASEKITILHPGVTLPNSNQLSADPTIFRKSFGISDDKIILLNVGRLTQRKGLPEFIQHCLAEIVLQFPDILLVIIGNEASDALNKQTSMITKIRQSALEAKVQDHVLLLGQVSEVDLSHAYLCSDLLVFPVLDLPGDVEGFGMVAVEAAAHGLPTAAFAVGGVTDAVANKISGWLVTSGDYTGFSNVILNYLERHKNQPSIQCAEISKQNCLHYATKFSWELFGEQLRATCQNIIFSNKK